MITKRNVKRGLFFLIGTAGLWAVWILLAWTVPAVAQYTPPPGCGPICKVTVLRIKSGTTLIVEDSAGNDIATFRDSGTIGGMFLTSSMTVQSGRLAFSAAGESIATQDGTLDIIGGLITSDSIVATGSNITGAAFLTASHRYSATGILDVATNPLVNVYDDGSTGSMQLTGTKSRGQCTISGTTCTAAVNSGAICICSNNAVAATVYCSVSVTTMTATALDTNVINYICL